LLCALCVLRGFAGLTNEDSAASWSRPRPARRSHAADPIIHRV